MNKTAEELINYAKSCYGHIVRINKSQGKSIKKGIVASVVDRGSNEIYLDCFGNYKINDIEDVTILDKPQSTKLSVGQIVNLNKKYNNFKQGDAIEIKGFLDKEEKRILTDGLMPGGWINSEDVASLPDFTNLRLRTFHEMVRDFGWNFQSAFKLNSWIVNRLGMSIKKEEISPMNSEKWMFNSSGYGFSFIITTNEPRNNDLKLYVETKERINEMREVYGDSAERVADIIEHVDKPLSSVSNGIPDKDMIRRIREGSYNTNGIFFRGEYLTVK